MNSEAWWLVLIIWGDKYSDDDCNILISSALRYSQNCAGVLVLTDDLQRKIDKRATLAPIPEEFNAQELKGGGLPIKICLFDLPIVPLNAPCIYLDLDSVVLASLDDIPALLREAKIWTIDVFPKRFSVFKRFINKVTGGKKFAIGNSSAFLFKNGFTGNPTIKFRDQFKRGVIPKKLLHDDRYIAWTMQQDIRGFSPFLISYYRLEFLSSFMFLNYVKSFFRNKYRNDIRVVTFAGSRTKINDIVGSKSIRDHHNRVGVWSDFLMGGVNRKIERELELFHRDANELIE